MRRELEVLVHFERILEMHYVSKARRIAWQGSWRLRCIQGTISLMREGIVVKGVGRTQLRHTLPLDELELNYQSTSAID